MTTPDRAAKVALHKRIRRAVPWLPLSDYGVEKIAGVVRREVKSAVEEELKACALIALTEQAVPETANTEPRPLTDWFRERTAIAAAIRARGKR